MASTTSQPSHATSDEALVDAARSGDREAFAQLYGRYFNPVFDFVTRLTRDRDEAADVAQDTFVRAFERLDSLQDGQRFKSWIFTIARNETLDRLRKSKRVRPLNVTNADGETEALDVVDPARLSDPAAAAEASAVAALVWEAAAGLDPRQLSILDLHLRQGLNSAEIADVLGVTKNNGYVMLNRLKEAVGSTIEALLLLRQGRDHCAELDGLVESFETEAMSPKLRRAIDRHASSCTTCTERKRTLVSPLTVLAALAPVPASAALADDILERVMERVPAEPEVESAFAMLADHDDDEASTLVQLGEPAADLEPDGDEWLHDMWLDDADLDASDDIDLELEL